MCQYPDSMPEQRSALDFITGKGIGFYNLTVLKLPYNYCLNPTRLSFWKSASRKVYAIDRKNGQADEIVIKDEHEEHVTNGHSQGMLFCNNTVKMNSRQNSCPQELSIYCCFFLLEMLTNFKEAK